MYPKNAATPPTIAIGSIYQISDGAIQTSGASARVLTAGGSWGAAAGTLTCDATSGCWYYAPTQGETNGEWFLVAIYKANCTSASVTVVPTASASAGYAVCPDTQKVDVETIKTKSVTVDAGGTTFPASIHASGAAVAKSPATLAAADVTGNLPADVKAYTVQPTVTGATLDAAYDPAKTAAQAGNQMDLVNAPNATALTAIGAKVEAMVLDEGDATALLAAIAAKVEAFLINEGDATATLAAIAAACNAAVVAGQVGTQVATIHGKLPAGSLGDATAANQSSIAAAIAALNDLDAAGVRSAVGLAAANLDAQLAALPTAAENADAAWDEALAGHAGAGTAGAALAAASAPTVQEVVDGVLDEPIAGHLGAGTVGAKLNAAGASGDPLENLVPGSYAAGTAGAALGNVPAVKAKTDLLGVAGVTVSSPVATGGRLLVLVRGDDYLAADGRALEWSSDDWPDLTGAAVALTARSKTTGEVALSAAGEVTVAGAGSQTVRVELPTAATSLLSAGTARLEFDVQATLAGGSIVTLVLGLVSVLADQTR